MVVASRRSCRAPETRDSWASSSGRCGRRRRTTPATLRQSSFERRPIVVPAALPCPHGERVLIVGASGAVGSAAVQIAKAFGAHVTGVFSGATSSHVLELGADAVIDYRTADFGSRTEKYDLILDIAGRISVGTLRRLLTPRGRLVIVGGEVGKWTGVRRQVWATLLSAFVPQHLGSFVVKQNAAYLGELNQLVAAGSLGVQVRRRYPLVEGADAMRELDGRSQVGRIAITT